ncbi:hypothetical protein ES705_20120 [subsurface metagenome]
MGQIRDSILKQMLELKLTIYQVSKMVEDKIPQRTVYTFLTGEKDMGTETASIIIETLGLVVKVDPNQTNLKKGIAMKAEKPKSFRGRIITEWEHLGKPNWSPRELLGMCLLIDFELRKEGKNPAKIFRKYVENGDCSNAMTWAQGLKFKTWEK